MNPPSSTILRNLPNRTPSSGFVAIHLKAIAGLAVAILLAGCGTGQWEVLRSSNPNRLAGQKHYAVAPVMITNLQVDGKPEAEFVAKMSPKTLASWESDKQSINTVFQESLQKRASSAGIGIGPTADAAALTLRPTVSWIESGYYRLPAWNAITRIRMNVAITDAKGAVQDEIVVKDKVAFDVMFHPDSGGRLRTVAESLGEKVARYLKLRSGQ